MQPVSVMDVLNWTPREIIVLSLLHLLSVIITLTELEN